jgi:hypothetical protein
MPGRVAAALGELEHAFLQISNDDEREALLNSPSTTTGVKNVTRHVAAFYSENSGIAQPCHPFGPDRGQRHPAARRRCQNATVFR